MAKKLSKEVWERRVNEAGSGRYEFIRWDVEGEFGSSKKCVVRCIKDGYEWSATVSSLVDSGYGCPQCSGVRRWTAEERIEQINKLENIEFISWADGYKNAYSRANVKCNVDGFEWSAAVNDLVNNMNGCSKCAGNIRLTNEERIEQINSLENIEFISWVGEYNNCYSRADVRCTIDGHKWSATVNSLTTGRTGCRKCSGKIILTEDERVGQINNIENVEFVSWVNGFKNKDSMVTVRCSIDGYEWTASVHNITFNKSGCPKCSKYGYDKSKDGFMYALRSECGKYIKIGISNNPKRRHVELKNKTPFNFMVVEQVNGGGKEILEMEKRFHQNYKSAGFSGFSGSTEWLVCTPELLEELRNLGDKR